MKTEIFEPCDELSPFVKCYWNLESDLKSTPVKNTIVPDGTMKLIFHYGDRYKHYPENGMDIILPKCFLIGQLTKPYVVQPLGDTGTFIVRFHPNGFLPLSDIPIKKMENKAIPLNFLFGNEGNELSRKILKAHSTEERIIIVERFLKERYNNKNKIDNMVKSTVEIIEIKKGSFSVNEYTKLEKINRRQLSRKFSTEIGLSPKQLSKTIRIQNALKQLLTQETSSLTRLAYEGNFFDQAHFIKEFREFTGITPKEFYGDYLKMSLIFDRK